MMQFSTFRIGERLLGLDIRLIQEINRIPEITPLPLSADYVRGFLNLRGQIVTILDLGVRLGLPRRTMDKDSHNIILNTRSHKSGARAQDPVGLFADGIGDVVEAEESQIEPLPANLGEMDGRFLSGVIKFQDELMVLFDLKRVLQAD